MAILQVQNLTYTYSNNTPFKNVAVSDISFTVNKGEVLGIIGHTGSGKSTVLQMLNGLLKPTSGKVLYKGTDIFENPKSLKDIRTKIGLVFQYPEYQLFEETVFDDIAFGPKNAGIEDDSLKERVIDAVKTVMLPLNILEKSPFDLSGGQKRRVAIAGIMAMQPEIIIFDEPTAGLDPSGRNIILNAMLEYRKKHNATIIIVSHSMEDMAEFADRLIVLNDGKVLIEGTTKEVFRHADILKSVGLNVPYITQVFIKLKELGLNVPTDIFTVTAATEYLNRYLKDGGLNA